MHVVNVYIMKNGLILTHFQLGICIVDCVPYLKKISLLQEYIITFVLFFSQMNGARLWACV